MNILTLRQNLPRLLAAGLCLLMGLPLARPTPASESRPLLWAIEGPVTSYIMGTMHLPDPRVSRLPPAVEQALGRSDVLYTEIPLTPAAQLQASASMLLPPGQTLRQLLPPDLSRRATDFVESRGLDMALFDRFTIWAFMAQLALVDQREAFLSGEPLDLLLFRRAVSQGQETAALETVQEQIGLFSDLSRNQQVELLAWTLEDLESAGETGLPASEALVRLYVDGDLLKGLAARMAEAVERGSPVVRRFNRSLVEERNHRMATRMMERLRERPDQAHFFAMGALHCAGPEGIPALLQEQGWRVRRVSPPPGQPSPPTP